MRRLHVLTVKRRSVVLLLAAIGLALAAYVSWYPDRSAVPVSLSAAVSGKTVVIDPGHGGVDPGAHTRDAEILEKDIVLQVARLLQQRLHEAAVHTVMTRQRDEDLADPHITELRERKVQDLGRRVQLANSVRADAYISLHVNAFPGSRWRGAQTFYDPRDKAGRLLAICIQESFRRRLGPNRRTAGTGDYKVLRDTKMPAVVVELGFISNPDERRLLCDPTYQQRIADAVFEGITQFFVQVSRGLPEEGDAEEEGIRPAAALPSSDSGFVVYFASDEGLVPAPVNIPQKARRDGEVALAQYLLDLLERGPDSSTKWHRTIPEGVPLYIRGIKEDLAYVDMSGVICEEHPGGSLAEKLTVYSIVNTLTQLPSIDGVQLLIDGSPLATIAGHMLLDRPLTFDASLVED